MKQQFIYPAVIYVDPETGIYVLVIKDVRIVCEGKTVEEAFKTAKEMLELYCECSLEMDCEIEEATSYEVTLKGSEGNIVLLVDYAKN